MIYIASLFLPPHLLIVTVMFCVPTCGGLVISHGKEEQEEKQ